MAHAFDVVSACSVVGTLNQSFKQSFKTSSGLYKISKLGHLSRQEGDLDYLSI